MYIHTYTRISSAFVECTSPQCQEELTPLGVSAVALLPLHTSSPERRITQKEIIAGEERPKYVLQSQYKPSPGMKCYANVMKYELIYLPISTTYQLVCIYICICILYRLVCMLLYISKKKGFAFVFVSMYVLCAFISIITRIIFRFFSPFIAFIRITYVYAFIIY